MDSFRELLMRLSEISKKDNRFHREAYLFVMAALSRAIRGLDKPRHLTGQELLGAIQDEAEEQFGPMASSVFEYWGVKNSLDFGFIVFNMVQEGILSKTETDCLEDFRDADFFKNLFDCVVGYRLLDDQNSLQISSK